MKALFHIIKWVIHAYWAHDNCALRVWERAQQVKHD